MTIGQRQQHQAQSLHAGQRRLREADDFFHAFLLVVDQVQGGVGRTEDRVAIQKLAEFWDLNRFLQIIAGHLDDLAVSSSDGLIVLLYEENVLISQGTGGISEACIVFLGHIDEIYHEQLELLHGYASELRGKQKIVIRVDQALRQIEDVTLNLKNVVQNNDRVAG